MTPDELEAWGNDANFKAFYDSIIELMSSDERLKLFWLMDTDPNSTFFWQLNERVMAEYPSHFTGSDEKDHDVSNV